jgi:hypothetical protein
VHDVGARPGREVVRGEGRGDLVALDRRHTQVERGHRHGVPADTAAEVGDVLEVRGHEAPGVERGDAQPAGLLEAGLGEEHALGERAEFRGGSAAQSVLREHGGDAASGMPVPTQPPHEPHDIVGGRTRLERIEQREGLGRQQFSQLGALHASDPPTLARSAHWHSDCMSANSLGTVVLALAGRVCQLPHRL